MGYDIDNHLHDLVLERLGFFFDDDEGVSKVNLSALFVGASIGVKQVQSEWVIARLITNPSLQFFHSAPRVESDVYGRAVQKVALHINSGVHCLM